MDFSIIHHESRNYFLLEVVTLLKITIKFSIILICTLSGIFTNAFCSLYRYVQSSYTRCVRTNRLFMTFRKLFYSLLVLSIILEKIQNCKCHIPILLLSSVWLIKRSRSVLNQICFHFSFLLDITLKMKSILAAHACAKVIYTVIKFSTCGRISIQCTNITGRRIIHQTVPFRWSELKCLRNVGTKWNNSNPKSNPNICIHHESLKYRI